LGWVSYLVDWVGFGSMKWTYGQLWSIAVCNQPRWAAEAHSSHAIAF